MKCGMDMELTDNCEDDDDAFARVSAQPYFFVAFPDASLHKGVLLTQQPN